MTAGTDFVRPYQPRPYRDKTGFVDAGVEESIQRMRRHERPDVFDAFTLSVKRRGEQICREYSSRWLQSILDTYADYGHPGALAVSVMMTMEKLSMTQETDRKHQRHLWDGLMSIPPSCDSMKGMFRRMSWALRDSPELLAIFKELVSRMLQHEPSLIARWAAMKGEDSLALDLASIDNPEPRFYSRP